MHRTLEGPSPDFLSENPDELSSSGRVIIPTSGPYATSTALDTSMSSTTSQMSQSPNNWFKSGEPKGGHLVNGVLIIKGIAFRPGSRIKQDRIDRLRVGTILRFGTKNSPRDAIVEWDGQPTALFVLKPEELVKATLLEELAALDDE